MISVYECLRSTASPQHSRGQKCKQNETPDSIVTGSYFGYHFRRWSYVMCLHKDPGDNISTILRGGDTASNGLYHYRLQFSSTQENIGMVSEGMGQVMLGYIGLPVTS